jgi:hypothetical protein
VRNFNFMLLSSLEVISAFEESKVIGIEELKQTFQIFEVFKRIHRTLHRRVNLSKLQYRVVA